MQLGLFSRGIFSLSRSKGFGNDLIPQSVASLQKQSRVQWQSHPPSRRYSSEILQGLGKNPLIRRYLGMMSSLAWGLNLEKKIDGPHIHPVIEGPTNIVQMPEVAIKGIEALTNRALVCRFNGLWPKLVDLHTWLEAS